MVREAVRTGPSCSRDLLDIWEYLSNDSFDAADRVLEDFYQAFNQLAEMPGMGRTPPDLTPRAVLFWRVHSYLSHNL